MRILLWYRAIPYSIYLRGTLGREGLIKCTNGALSLLNLPWSSFLTRNLVPSWNSKAWPSLSIHRSRTLFPLDTTTTSHDKAAAMYNLLVPARLPHRVLGTKDFCPAPLFKIRSTLLQRDCWAAGGTPAWCLHLWEGPCGLRGRGPLEPTGSG